jgi:hypothetical protein
LPKRAFKKRIRSILLDILQNENTYLDIESLSCKIKKRSRNEASNWSVNSYIFPCSWYTVYYLYIFFLSKNVKFINM